MWHFFYKKQRTDIMPRREPDIKTSILSRVSLLYLIFFCVCMAIIFKIVWIQVGTDSSELKGQSIQYSYRSEVIPAVRGNILSCDGRTLSTTIPLYEIRMDMNARGLHDTIFTKQVGILSDSLALFFGDRLGAEYLSELKRARHEKKGYFLINKRKVNYLELQRLKSFPLFCLGPNRGGFLAVEVGRRVQPHGELASRAIGFVNTTGVKVGIEGSFDNRLRGVDGITIKQKISGSFWVPISSPLNIDSQPGVDVVTTIDVEIQDIAQTALRERLKEVNANWGTVVVMEVSTGHVKALANATYNRSTGEIVEDYNYALGMSMEPGSTFKLAGLMAILDDCGGSLNTMVDTESGVVNIGQAKVVDTRSGGYGVISLQEVFEYSSNIGMAKSINRYYGRNPAKFVDYLHKLQLDRPLGLQIMGEARPVIYHPGERGWDGTTLTMMSYGYALRITPMQSITLYNAVANGGKMVKPIFVTDLMRNGDVVEHYPVEVLDSMVCGPKALSAVQRALRGVVVHGTAKSLENPLYGISAKTGTAQVAVGNKGYYANGGRHYFGSIVGFFPSEKPRYTIFIGIKTFHTEGSGDIYYGGALTSPLFETISSRIFTSKYDFLKPVVSHHRVMTPDVVVRGARGDALRAVLEKMGAVGSAFSSTVMGAYATPALAEALDTVTVAGEAASPRSDLALRAAMERELLGRVGGYAQGDALRLLESDGYVVQSVGRGVVRALTYVPDSTMAVGRGALRGGHSRDLVGRGKVTLFLK